MGKNIAGGNHKHTKRTGSAAHAKVRVSECDEEVYGIINKMLGNGQCHVKCNDDVMRLCIIRGSFRGKNKSSNIIKVGTWVLVGVRDWESVADDKLPKCDLLESYSESDKTKLLQTTTNFMIMKKEENEITNITDEMSEIVIGEINFDEI
jgi:initiation factor 1A